VLAGRWLAHPVALPDRLNGLFAAGAIGMVAGLMWNWSFPINKNLWTSSYVVFTAGMACVAIATIAWLTDIRGWRRWASPLVTYGLNPLVAFVGSGALARMLGTVQVSSGGETIALQQAIYRSAFAPWLEPRNASLAYAVAFVLLWYGILKLLQRRHVVLKV
jgi:predicted acyltransferase